jgi:hypothetical protein
MFSPIRSFEGENALESHDSTTSPATAQPMEHQHSGDHQQPGEHPHPAHIINTPDQHAFLMLGTNTLFLCHLTMYGMEEHMYQFIVQATLPVAAMQMFLHERQKNPAKTYFLGNSDNDLLTVPDLHSGARRSFIADVFRGIPNKPHYDDWPWREQTPVISKVPVTIERVVYFRHFADTFEAPRTLTYVMFGSGNEAHMTNCQTKRPDFDHILSLAGAPDWLPARQLESGVHVSVNVHREAGQAICSNPLPKPTGEPPNADCMVRYRGMGDELPVRIGFHHWFCTKVSNDPDPCSGQAAEPCASPP